MYRFANKLRANRPALRALLWTRSPRRSGREHPDFGRDVAIDASDLPARRTVSATSANGGKTRAVQRPRRLVGAPLRCQHPQGRRLLRVQDRTWRSARDGPAARVAGSRPRGTTNRCSSPRCSTRYALAASSPRRAPMDKGYDNNRVYAECEDAACDPVIPLQGRRRGSKLSSRLRRGGRLFPRIPRHTRAVPRPLPSARGRGTRIRDA